ncbi:MAG: hypothetical protein M1827_002717 [Pycnora praestabilis]|nr:MAG: hypothetical protein M1827_002717 [Pycnora praestabilis]
MDTRGGSLFTRQPGRLLYILFASALTIARLPLWLVYYIPPRLRQHPKWTYRQAIMVQILKTFIYHSSIFEMRTPLSLEPGVEGKNFVMVEPTNPERYVGVCKDREIKPKLIGGTWYPSPYQEGDQQQDVILHFHGGAYATGTGRRADAGYAAQSFMKYANAKTFCPQYRLGTNPGGRFPAALQDAVSSYQYLLDQGISSKAIVISGDSAGANLALALLRYIEDSEGLFDNVAAAWIWSPWGDLTGASDPRTADLNMNSSTDFITGGFGAWGARGFVPDFMSAADPYITTITKPFATNTPIFIQTGTAEVLYDQNIALAKALKGVEGNLVELVEEPNAPHDIILVGGTLGFEAEAERVAKKAAEFLRNERLM